MAFHFMYIKSNHAAREARAVSEASVLSIAQY